MKLPSIITAVGLSILVSVAPVLAALPTVSTFAVAATAVSPVPVTAFTASDSDGTVVGYMITQTSTKPAAADARWTGTPWSSFATASLGSITLYAWSKDNANGVSNSRNAATNVVGGHNHDAAYVNEGQANSIATPMIVDGAVTGGKIVDGAVGSAKIADGAVTGAKLADPVYTKSEVDALIGALQSQIAALQGQNAGLQNLLQHFSVEGNDIYISGANLHVVNGRGITDYQPNALGNLIVGYNELRNDGSDYRGGSHNLVLGKGNNYRWTAGIIGGEGNETAANFSSVLGGTHNSTGYNHAVVITGYDNTASGPSSFVGSGLHNTAVGPFAVVLGGRENVAGGNGSTVGGGGQNNAAGQYSSVSGGSGNQALATTSSVSGGAGNLASGMHSSVSGGLQRSVAGELNWAAGSLLELQ